MTERPIDSITIGKRHRKDVGDIDSLAASIRDVGLLHPPVITPDGTLVAGERRIRACESLGWTRVEVRVVDLDNVTRGEAAENFERQDFTPSEAVSIRRALEPELKAEAGARMKAGQPSENFSKGRAADQASAFTGYSRFTLDKAEAVVAAAEAEPEKYGRLIEDMDRTGRVDGVFRRFSNMRQAEAIRAEPPPLPNGPFRVAALDVPWAYETRQADPSHRGVCPYPTMTLEAIRALPVADLMAPDSILWMWAPNLRAVDGTAAMLVRGWGFEPKTLLTWVKTDLAGLKVRFGFGDWLRGASEQCIMAVRGNPVHLLGDEDTVIHAPMRAHSQKPDEFYHLVESTCPAPRYATLFHRGAAPNDRWVPHGDEVPPPAPSGGTKVAAPDEGRDTELRYVPHADVEQFTAEGWTATEGLTGTHHGEYSVLMHRLAPG